MSAAEPIWFEIYHLCWAPLLLKWNSMFFVAMHYVLLLLILVASFYSTDLLESTL